MLVVRTAIAPTEASAAMSTAGTNWVSLQLSGSPGCPLHRGRSLIAMHAKPPPRIARPIPRTTLEMPGNSMRRLLASGKAKKIRVSRARPGSLSLSRMASRLIEMATNARPKSAPDAPATARQKSCHWAGSWAITLGLGSDELGVGVVSERGQARDDTVKCHVDWRPWECRPGGTHHRVAV